MITRLTNPLGVMMYMACLFLVTIPPGADAEPGVPRIGINADYLIFVHQDLYCDAVQQLAEYRESQGREVRIITISDGMENTYIRDKIIHYYDYSLGLPVFVLLIGDAADDPDWSREANSSAGNYIPSYRVSPVYGNVLFTDDIYVCVDPPDDLVLPDLFIGRIPATSQQEITGYVNKLLEYEADAPDQAWKSNYLIVAGDSLRDTLFNSPQPGYVRYTANQISDFVSSQGWNSQILFYSASNSDQVRKDSLAGAIDDGQLLITALGTGADWRDFVYYTFRDPARIIFDAYTDLHNFGKYPTIFGLSCHMGYFDQFYYDGLTNWSKNLVLPESTGAIAFLAPAGATTQGSDVTFAEELNKQIIGERITDIGRLVNRAKLEVWESGLVVPDNIRSIILFGDPALTLSTNSGFVKQFSATSFELKDRVPYQNKVYNSSGSGLRGTVACIYPESKGFGTPWGERAYRVSGEDTSLRDTYIYWELYDLGFTIDNSVRYLSFWLYIELAPTDPGHVSIDAIDSTGTYLHDYSNNGYIVDQFGVRIGPEYHTSPTGQWQYYSFDLGEYGGQTLSKLLIGYDDGLSSEAGKFMAYIDGVKFDSIWGYCPHIDFVDIPSEIASGAFENIKVDASDLDVLYGYGDSTSYLWTSILGTIKPDDQPQAKYKAPFVLQPVTDTITIEVFDRGNNCAAETAYVVVNPKSGLAGEEIHRKKVGNYPNPFNSSTVISFSTEITEPVEIVIFDIKGRKVRSIDHHVHTAGEQSVVWDGLNSVGNAVASGVYYFSIKGTNTKEARGMMVLLR